MLANSEYNRQLTRDHAELFQTEFPASPDKVKADLAAGGLLIANGYLLL